MAVELTPEQKERMENLAAMQPMDTERPIDEELELLGLVTIDEEEIEEDDEGPLTTVFSTDLTANGWAWPESPEDSVLLRRPGRIAEIPNTMAEIDESIYAPVTCKVDGETCRGCGCPHAKSDDPPYEWHIRPPCFPKDGDEGTS